MALLQTFTNTLSKVFPVTGKLFLSPVVTVTKSCALATSGCYRKTGNRWLRLSSTQSHQGGDKSQNHRTKKRQEEKEENEEVSDPYLPPWPGGINPHTGERGGPRGPEPTRYGDWERKGRVSDF